MKYIFYSDAGHGWLKVPVVELIKLDLCQKITGCSYLSPSGKWAYLEEDCDLTTFLLAIDGNSTEWMQANTKTKYSTRSSIRGYRPFNRGLALYHNA
jgi:hypothetical protein